MQTRDALRGVRAAAGDATQATHGLASGFRIGVGDVLRFAGALTGVQIGLSLFTSAGAAARDAIGGAVQAQAEAQRTARATAAAYGALANSFTRFASALSSQTGFTKESILEAALSARTLSTNYGLTIQQTQRLIQVSADLARVRGIGVAEAFERVQSAIRGEAEASEFLGLTLNATFLKNNAMNGSLKTTFEAMTDAQKAQVVYGEVLRQTAVFQGLAASSAGGLDDAMNRANTSGHNLSVTLGKMIEGPAIASLNTATNATNALDKSLRDAAAGVSEIEIPINRLGAFGQAGNIVALALALRLLTAGTRPTGGVVPDFMSEEVTLRQEEAERAALAAADADRAWRALGATGRIVNETFQNTHKSITQVAADIGELLGRTSSLTTILGALDAGDTGANAAVNVAADIARIDARVNALRVEAALQREIASDREASKITDPRDAAGATAARERVRLTEQLLPLELALAEAKRQQSEFADAVAANQAAENAVILSILPQRQEQARLEWEMANAVDRRVQLRQEETRLLAQQAALQPNNALEDTQAAIQRARLTLAIRGLPAEERSGARRQIRDLTRFVEPTQAREAFDANRDVALAQRAETATGIAAQLRDNPIKQQIEGLRLAALAGERTAFAVDQNSLMLDLVGKSFTGNTDRMTKALDAFVKKAGEPTKVALTIDVTGPAGNTVTVHELIEAADTAVIPPIIPQSGAR